MYSRANFLGTRLPVYPNRGSKRLHVCVAIMRARYTPTRRMCEQQQRRQQFTTTLLCEAWRRDRYSEGYKKRKLDGILLRARI